MKLLKVTEIVSVKLFEIEVSEGELAVYESCMRYVRENLTTDRLEDISGAYEDEFLAIYKDVLALLTKHTDWETWGPEAG